MQAIYPVLLAGGSGKDFGRCQENLSKQFSKLRKKFISAKRVEIEIFKKT